MKRRGEVYADKPFAALDGPELMRLTRFEPLGINPGTPEDVAPLSPVATGGVGNDSLVKPDPGVSAVTSRVIMVHPQIPCCGS